MTKHQTLREIRPRSYKNYEGNIGIEIETESKNSYDAPALNWWAAHSDGSLRNFGIEYVLRQPLVFGSEDYYSALKEFKGWVAANSEAKWISSVYSSVHVHFNMTNKTPRFIANFITLYVLLENVLTRYCGSDRDGNLFCLKTKNAEESVLLYQKLFMNINANKKSFAYFIGTLNENMHKYSALNICPLKTLGSVEVRTHAGTLNTEEIDLWISMLYCLYGYASIYNNPKEIFDDVRTLGAEAFVTKIFDEYAQFLVNKMTEDDVESTYFYAKSLLYCIDDWEKFGLYDDKKLYTQISLRRLYFEEEGYLVANEYNHPSNNLYVTSYITTEDQ